MNRWLKLISPLIVAFILLAMVVLRRPTPLLAAAPFEVMINEWSQGNGSAASTFNVMATSAITRIHAIQGSSDASNFNGQTVLVEGIVVGDFPDLAGFYLEEEDSDADADPATSEGIFVFMGGSYNNPAVDPGDKVQVVGAVDEFFGQTQIDNDNADLAVLVITTGDPLPTPAPLTLPFASADQAERYEGMLVQVAQPLSVTEVFNLGRGGVVSLSAGGRLVQPTQVVTPGAAANNLQAQNDLNQLLLDDGMSSSASQNPDPVIHPAPELSATNSLRGGDTISNVVGVLAYSWSGWSGTDAYRIHPLQPLTYLPTNPRPTAPNLEGRIRVAGFNVLNYFTTLDDPNTTTDNICGPNANLECRGADSSTEFTRQRTKIITGLLALNADIVGLVEIENNAMASLQDLVDGLNALAGPDTYAYIDTGSIGTDAIKVGLLYKTATISPVGSYQVLDSSIDANFIDTRNRPSLAQTFVEQATNEKLTVVINHLKSKDSACTDIGDPDTGDGQGNCNQTRLKAAQALATWLATDPTGSGDPDFLLIGDFNSYAMEDPISALKAGGFTNLVERFGGSYGYVFDGQWGTLDYGLASAGLTLQVAGALEWHINADESIALDYNEEFKSPAQRIKFYNPDYYRASDHDPVVVGLNLGAITPGQGDLYLPLISK